MRESWRSWRGDPSWMIPLPRHKTPTKFALWTAPSWPCMFGSSFRAKKNDSCGSSRMVRAASPTGLSPSCRCMVRSNSPVSSPDAWWSSPKVRRPPTRSGVRDIPAVGTVTGATGCPSDDVLAKLDGFDVAVWPDADPQGRKHAAKLLDGLLRTRKGKAEGLFEVDLAALRLTAKGADAGDWYPEDPIDDLLCCAQAVCAPTSTRAVRAHDYHAADRDQGWKNA